MSKKTNGEGTKQNKRVRANGEGAIYKRPDGRWTARLTLHDGRRKDFYGKTKQDVSRKLEGARRRQQEGLPAATPERLTFGQFLMDWLESVAKPSVKESTYTSYEVQVRRHIEPQLGKCRLISITPSQLQRFYADKLTLGLSPRTVQYQHRIIYMALAAAQRWDLVARNVAQLVDPPRISKRPIQTFNVEQARSFLKAVENDRLYALYVVTLCVGLRRGEALALWWDDFDMEKGTLSVRRTYSKVKGGWKISEPKTPGSARVMKLPDIAIQALLVHHVNQLQERLRAGSYWTDHGLIFTTTRGTLIDGDNMRREFQDRLRRAELPLMPFHSLRHSAATLMLTLGVQPKVVAEMLGHSRISVTMDTYSHVLPHVQEEAAIKMDRLLVGVR